MLDKMYERCVHEANKASSTMEVDAWNFNDFPIKTDKFASISIIFSKFYQKFHRFRVLSNFIFFFFRLRRNPTKLSMAGTTADTATIRSNLCCRNFFKIWQILIIFFSKPSKSLRFRPFFKKFIKIFFDFAYFVFHQVRGRAGREEHSGDRGAFSGWRKNNFKKIFGARFLLFWCQNDRNYIKNHDSH